MITAVAIDDEPLALNIIKALCGKVDFIELLATFTEPATAIDYLNVHPVDLLFLDINMPSMSGIELYKSISKKTMVIFTTAHSIYAVEGFSLDAIDYLLKPFDLNRFKKAVEKAREYKAYLNLKSAEPSAYLFVRVDYSMVKVVVADIQYIEGLDNYIKIHFDDNKSLLVRMSMKAIAEKLPEPEFVRVHRSFIVPFSKVQSVRNKTLFLKHKEIPVGTNYVDTVMHLFKESDN